MNGHTATLLRQAAKVMDLPTTRQGRVIDIKTGERSSIPVSPKQALKSLKAQYYGKTPEGRNKMRRQLKHTVATARYKAYQEASKEE